MVVFRMEESNSTFLVNKHPYATMKLIQLTVLKKVSIFICESTPSS